MAQNTPEWAFITLLFLCTLPGGGGEATLRQWTPQEVYSVLDESCFLAVVDPESSPGGGAGLTAALNALIQAFYGESLVQIGILNAKKFLWPSGKALRVKDGVSGRYIEGSDDVDLLWFPRRVPDRSCLVRPAHTLTPPVGLTVPAPRTARAMVGYLNDKCGTFRNLNGTLNNGGRHRLDILRNLFRVEAVSETTMGMVYTCYMASDNPFNQSHAWAEFRDQEGAASLDHCLSYNDCHGSHPTNYHVSQNTKSHTPFTSFTNKGHKSRKTAQKHNSNSELGSLPIAQCKVLHTPPTKEEFFHNYLKRSKPFILRNHTTTWTAFSKWTNEYLRKTFGEKEVNIKLTPSGDYEGVEKADLWENFKTFKIPQEVKRQLQFPDLVTVRPDSKDVKFSEFMDLINKTARQGAGERLLSAYLEYSSIPAYLPSLEGDLDEPKFASRLLQRKHLNIWLSDGHTLGRLHFDQYDNLLCQISGSKTVTLFEPHDNTAMYEAHIQQATLTYNAKTTRFRRKQLEDSTSMVMSPVNLLQPDFKRFPRFAAMRPLNCTLTEGDVLYLPAYWWHEVLSRPSQTQPRNLAVNFWYEPFLTREFPCPECTLDVNPEYHHLLYDHAV